MFASGSHRSNGISCCLKLRQFFIPSTESHPPKTRGLNQCPSPELVSCTVTQQAHTCDIAGFWWLVSLVAPLHHHTDPWAPQWQAEGICKEKMRYFQENSRISLQCRKACVLCLNWTAFSTAHRNSEQLRISTKGKPEITLNTSLFSFQSWSWTVNQRSCGIQTKMYWKHLQLLVQINSLTRTWCPPVGSTQHEVLQSLKVCFFSFSSLTTWPTTGCASPCVPSYSCLKQRVTTLLPTGGCWLYQSVIPSRRDHHGPLLAGRSALQVSIGPCLNFPPKKSTGALHNTDTTHVCFCPRGSI